MTKQYKPGENPFSQKVNAQLSRRVFSQGLFVAGIAATIMPMTSPNAAKASTVMGSPITGSLRQAIDEQLMAFNGQASLASAAEDEAFHEFLGQKLKRLHPASAG